MSTELATTKPQAVALASKADLTRMIGEIAAVYPPKLTDDMPLKAWMRLISETVGEHPAQILIEARSVLMSTSQFAPTPKEFVDAVLAAYTRCKLPLSEDAKRHLAYRKKASTRYITGENGSQRFVDDAKLGAISFVSIAGVHANMVMDALPFATVDDIEKSLIATSDQFGKKDSTTLKDVLKALEFHAVVANAYRNHGKPTDFCGGPVAEDNQSYQTKFTSPFLALSKAFVDKMRAEYPKAMWARNSLSSAFGSVAYKKWSTLVPDGYGSTFQAVAEAEISDAMKELDEKAAREEALTVNSDWRFANARKDDAAKVDAEDRAFALKKYVEAKGYAVKVYEKPTAYEAAS
jgi:hypothetical protein